MDAFERPRRNPSRMLGAGKAAKRQPSFVPDNRLGLLHGGACCGDPARWRPIARELEGKVAAVTGAASGIGFASTEAMLAAGSRVVMVDRDAAALKVLCDKHGDAAIPLVIDLLDPMD